MGGNRNHPKKGNIIKVEPIRRREDRGRIEAFLPAGRVTYLKEVRAHG